jgi:hypothetical protein
MEILVDAVGEGTITMEEFEKREREIEKGKARELGEEEDEKKDEEEVAEKVREKVVVEVLRVGEKRGCGRPKRKVSEGGETDAEGAEIGMVYIVDQEQMVSKIYFLFLSFLIFVYVIVHTMSRDEVGARMPSATQCNEVPKMHEGEAGMPLGKRKAGEYGRKGVKKEGCY